MKSPKSKIRKGIEIPVGKTIKKVNTGGLRRLNEQSISNGYNRTLSERFFEEVDPRGTHILSVLMVHEHAQMRRISPHYRCMLFAKTRGKEDPVVILLDLPAASFNSLKTAGA